MPAKLEQMRKKIKRQLKKDHPDWSDDKLEQRSWAIAQTQWKKMTGHTWHGDSTNSEYKEEEKYDEEGRLIVSENTKFVINGGITSIEEWVIK